MEKRNSKNDGHDDGNDNDDSDDDDDDDHDDGPNEIVVAYLSMRIVVVNGRLLTKRKRL